jgi:hypothetical protein
VRRLLISVVVLAVNGGLASGSNGGGPTSVLYSGVTGPDGVKTVITDARAVSEEHLLLVSWLKETRGLYDTKLEQNFPCPSEPAFTAALGRASATYRVAVRSVTCHQSPQMRAVERFAPLIVIESDHYVRTAAAIDRLQRAVDPMSLYPVFIEAVDDRGVPYAAAFHVYNEGGEWARADPLLPAPHL